MPKKTKKKLNTNQQAFVDAVYYFAYSDNPLKSFENGKIGKIDAFIDSMSPDDMSNPYIKKSLELFQAKAKKFKKSKISVPAEYTKDPQFKDYVEIQKARLDAMSKEIDEKINANKKAKNDDFMKSLLPGEREEVEQLVKQYDEFAKQQNKEPSTKDLKKIMKIGGTSNTNMNDGAKNASFNQPGYGNISSGITKLNNKQNER